MLDFIPANIRKRIYETLASLNAITAAIIPLLVATNVITDSLASQILTIAAGILSAAGFVLAARNTNVVVNDSAN